MRSPAGVVARLREHAGAGAAAWDSPQVEHASRFVRARAGTQAAAGRRWFLDWRGALALAQVVRAEPVLEVRLTGSPAGLRILDDLSPRTLGVPRNRICVAVWDVPFEVAPRPGGKRHQALRTALTAAQRAGLGVAEIDDRGERVALARRAVAGSPRLAQWATSAPRHDEQRWWAVSDADGALRGLAAVVVDAEWASLVTLVGLGSTREASDARYVLHHAVTRALSAAGVRHLAVLDDSPLLTDAGARHLQRVLGYRLARLRRPTVIRDPWPAPVPGYREPAAATPSPPRRLHLVPDRSVPEPSVPERRVPGRRVDPHPAGRPTAAQRR